MRPSSCAGWKMFPTYAIMPLDMSAERKNNIIRLIAFILILVILVFLLSNAMSELYLKKKPYTTPLKSQGTINGGYTWNIISDASLTYIPRLRQTKECNMVALLRQIVIK